MSEISTTTTNEPLSHDNSDPQPDSTCSRIVVFPEPLSILVSSFIKDLKEPKYAKPLTVHQLAYLFQKFYFDFDRAIDLYHEQQQQQQQQQHVLDTAQVPIQRQHTPSNSLSNISSGLSGIFNRSRSSSATSISTVDSGMKPPCPMIAKIDESVENESLSKENVFPNDKCEYMKALERELFDKISSLGTNVPDSKVIEKFRFENLFKNNQEYIDYNSLFNLKLKELQKTNERENLKPYLDLETSINIDELIEDLKLQDLYHDFVKHKLSPVDKMEALILLHKTIDQKMNQLMGVDIFLPLLIYLTIKFGIKQLFLTYKFIKLFRYKELLVGEELFALTNIEAVVRFISDLVDLPKMELYNFKISEQVYIPESDEEDLLNNSKLLEDQEFLSNTSNYQPQNVNHHLKGHMLQSQHSQGTLRNTINNNRSFSSLGSLKSVIGKFYYPPNTPPLPQTVPSASTQRSVQSNTRVQPTTPIPSSSTSAATVTVENEFSDKYKKFQGRSFQNMTVQELEEMFANYQKMCEYL